MMTIFRARRQSRRWLDGDCPKGVLAIYDSRADGERYTVFYAEPITSTGETWFGFRGMSADPFDVYGISIYSEMREWQVRDFRHRSAHRKTRWSDLPADVKTVILRDLADDAEAA